MSGTRVHVFREDFQPATDFIVGGDPDFRIQHAPDEVLRCFECWDWRYAKDVVVQAYYDGPRYYCADECYSGNGLRGEEK